MQRVVTFNSIFGAVSAALYVVTKVVAIELALLWLIIYSFHASRTTAIIAAVVITIPAIWACYKAAKLAYDAETDPINNDD